MRRWWAPSRELPPKQRTAVVQRYLLDRPYAEVAAVVGCSEAAARQNVRAGLQRLRERLGDGGDRMRRPTDDLGRHAWRR